MHKQEVTGPSANNSRIANTAFWGLIAIYCAWVFSLPLFPTQDGPIHLYYTHVIARLLAGSDLFGQFFAIRQLPPPYIVHYALLLLLMKMISAAAAEKVVVCLFIAGFACGFRYLARAIGPGADLVALWVMPLSLNWMLGMGFHNYCLSMAIALWAAGVWLRVSRTRSTRGFATFLALVAITLFTHPVPLLLLLVFVGSELLLRLIQDMLRSEQTLRRVAMAYKAQIVTFVFACCSFGYLALFVNVHRTAQNIRQQPHRLEIVQGLVSLRSLSLLDGTTIAVAYRLSFYLLLVAALGFASHGFWTRLKTRHLQASDLLALVSGAMMVVIPLLPASINGSDHFADRLVIYIWVAAFAASSYKLILVSRWQKLSIAFACCFGLGALFLADRYIRPVAKSASLIESVEAHVSGNKGMFIYTFKKPGFPRVSFDPYAWIAGRFFLRSDTVMLDAPWLDLPIIPIVPRGDLFANTVPPDILNYPERFNDFLVRSADARASVYRSASFILFIGYPFPSWIGVGAFTDKKHQWTCRRDDWIAVCTASVS